LAKTGDPALNLVSDSRRNDENETVKTFLHQDIVKEIQIAHAALTTGQMAGLGTESSPNSENLYVPIRAGDFTSGVLVLRPADRGRFQHPEQLFLLESLVKQVTLSLEVEFLAGSTKPQAVERG
jgi:K+-sensing histidine kinase KdpD